MILIAFLVVLGCTFFIKKYSIKKNKTALGYLVLPLSYVISLFMIFPNVIRLYRSYRFSDSSSISLGNYSPWIMLSVVLVPLIFMSIYFYIYNKKQRELY